MIFELFITFIIICFLLIFIGYYTDIKVMSLIGCTGIFLLGLILQASTVTYQTSTNITEVGSTTIVTPIYSTIDDTVSLWLGRWLAFAGGLGFILVIASNSKVTPK